MKFKLAQVRLNLAQVEFKLAQMTDYGNYIFKVENLRLFALTMQCLLFYYARSSCFG